MCLLVWVDCVLRRASLFLATSSIYTVYFFLLRPVLYGSLTRLTPSGFASALLSSKHNVACRIHILTRIRRQGHHHHHTRMEGIDRLLRRTTPMANHHHLAFTILASHRTTLRRLMQHRIRSHDRHRQLIHICCQPTTHS